jgi:ligand-binding sensor domain-containing protein/signal transduction histidine kinase
MTRASAPWRAWPACAAVLAMGSAQALDPSLAVTQYALRTWTAAEGLPQNSVQAVAQTPDGYVWVGTQEGLARFDGVAFTVFNRANTPALRHNYVYALLVDRAGALWIGTNGGGVTRLHDGTFTTFTTAEGLPDDTVIAMAEGPHGELWLGTNHGVAVRDGAGFRRFEGASAFARDRIMAVLPDRDGGIWFGSYTQGAGRWHEGRFTHLTTREGLSGDAVWSLYQDRSGAIWIGTMGGGLDRLAGGRLQAFAPKDLGSESVLGVREDRDGNFWFATDGGGLVRWAHGRFTALRQQHGFSHDTVWPLLEDRDGILWAGTLSGLNQLRDAPVVPYGRPEGVTDDVVLTVAEDAAGAAWFGTNAHGVVRFADGRATAYRKADGLVHDSVRSVYPDSRGNLWIGTVGGLSRLGNGRFTSFRRRDGLSNEKISTIHEDRDGVIWVGTFGGGLNRYADGRFAPFPGQDVLANDRVLAIETRAAGGLWVATDGGGLALLENGRVTRYRARDGVPDDHLSALHEDADGTLWIGTGGAGLGRLRDGRFATFTTEHGLFDNLAHQVLEDARGTLWISGNRGIYGVARHELEEVAAGLRKTVRPIVLGVADGMRSSECNGASQPAGWRGAGGRLWYATMAGAVLVEPARLRDAGATPPAFVTRAVADGRMVPAAGGTLPPGRGALEFAYTALDYRRPEQLRFRYQLEGFDEGWVEAGSRRAAHYTNIPPGRYRFLVAAAGANGSWGEVAAAGPFVLRAVFWQTGLFQALAALALLAVLAAAHHRRSSVLSRRAREMTALARARELAEAEVRKLNVELEARVALRTAQLEAANKDLESFSYSISHDLKAPLRGINGFCEALLEEDAHKLDERGRSRLERVAAAARRLTQLVDDLLKLSGVSRAPVKLEHVDLSALARSIVADLREHEPQRPVECRIEDGIVARADARLLGTALTNLIGNAWKYTGATAAPRIEIGTAPQPDGSVACFVRDNGAGFDMTYVNRLFTPFQRLHGASEFPGSGIGLAIVKRVLDKHEGRVWAEGRPGAGATFYFALPAAAVPGSAP